MFVICVETIIQLLLHNLRDCTFYEHGFDLNKQQFWDGIRISKDI